MEPQAYPEPYTILPKSPHIHRDTLILLHGTSANGPDFAAPLLATTFTSRSHHAPTTIPLLFPSCKLIFPTGALRPTTVFSGRESNAWFDVHSFANRTIGEDSLVFRHGLGSSVRYLTGLIKDEVEILRNTKEKERGKVFIWGFSQGAAMAVILLLSGELEKLGILSELGGVIGMSGWLPLRTNIREIINVRSPVYDKEDLSSRETRACVAEFLCKYLDLDDGGAQHIERVRVGDAPEFLDIPILLAHGRADEKVKFEWGLQMVDILTELDLRVEAKAYFTLAHWWTENEIADVARFLGKGMSGQR